MMRKLPTIIGDGTFFGGCPRCQTNNSMFVTAIKGKGVFVCV